jgi:hypothetical protein
LLDPDEAPASARKLLETAAGAAGPLLQVPFAMGEE